MLYLAKLKLVAFFQTTYFYHTNAERIAPNLNKK